MTMTKQAIDTLKEAMIIDLSGDSILGGFGCYAYGSGCEDAMNRWYRARKEEYPKSKHFQIARDFLLKMSDEAFLTFYRKAAKATVLKNVDSSILVPASWWTCFKC